MTCSKQIICGELHYPRIPPQYWSARLAMARAMGLNAISTYVFWNRHERREGEYDFTGENDVAQFVRLAQQHGLDVILRPGPYVCAEWDFGGLPSWLLKDGEIGVRSTDKRFMEPARRWLRRFGEEVAPLQRVHGGPIIAVQLENEYGAFAGDQEYLLQLRAALTEARFSSPLFTIDQPGDLERGAVSDVPIAVTFAPGDPGAQFVAVHALRPNVPLLCGEYWAGWFDHWGEPHAQLDDAQQARDLDWMLSNGVSVNIYMFHGGTNFGFWNGANAFDPHPYQPTTSSYDYQAALDEAGRPTRKYLQFREIIAAHTGITPSPVPATARIIEIPAFTLHETAVLHDLLEDPVEASDPLPMETLGQDFGFTLYRTALREKQSAVLSIYELRDYAIVLLDGRVIAHLDRRLGESEVQLTCDREGAMLEIFVENCGRINYGPMFPAERKGITRAVRWNGAPLQDWQMYTLPFETLAPLVWSNEPRGAPCFYRGWFGMDEPADTFLDVSDLHKGVLWVNGHNAGRFWRIGPQRSLYIPGVWLSAGRNQVVALDLFDHPSPPSVCGRTDHVIASQ